MWEAGPLCPLGCVRTFDVVLVSVGWQQQAALLPWPVHSLAVSNPGGQVLGHARPDDPGGHQLPGDLSTEVFHVMEGGKL